MTDAKHPIEGNLFVDTLRRANKVNATPDNDGRFVFTVRNDNHISLASSVRLPAITEV